VAGAAVVGCGSGGSDSSSSSTSPSTSSSPSTTPEQAKSPQPTDSSDQSSAKPKSASPNPAPIDKANLRVKALKESFPPPKPAPKAKGLSEKAISQGQEACAGKTPSQVKAAYLNQAKPKLEPDQLKLVSELARYEAEAKDEASFIAGQIAATVYAATLPEAQHDYGFEGCVYALSRVLAGEISKERE
jgi:hypothetical protein